MSETLLYTPVKRFLETQGYQVKGEIGDCDVMAVRGDEAPVIVELKKQFSINLVLQGIDRQGVSDAVYLAVHAPKRRATLGLVKLCKRLGLGLLTVTGQHVVALADPLPYQPRKDARRKTRLLREFANRIGDPNEGGSTRRPQMTAYRQDALRCTRHLGEHGACKVADIRQRAGVARAAGILRDDVYGWFVREHRGIYALTTLGQAALVTYATMLPGLGREAAG